MRASYCKTPGDEGISPIISVILMITVTVILSTIVAAFILQLGTSIDQSPSASIEVSEYSTDDGYKVEVRSVSMPNADKVVVNAPDGREVELRESGETVSIDGLEAGDRVTIIVVWEGEKRVVQVYQVRG